MPKKRKHTDSDASIATTVSLSNDKSIDRTKLKAKRLFSASDDDKKNSTDTPQMKKLREQMQQRQIQGNAPRRSKITQSPNVRSSPRRSAAKKPEDATSVDFDNSTPQMRAIRQSINSKKSTIAVKSRQSLDLEEKRLRTRSQSSSNASNNLNDGTLNKSSRRSSQIDERIARMRTSEAPPGVSAKRTIIDSEDVVPTKNLAERRLKKLRASLEANQKDSEEGPPPAKQAKNRKTDAPDVYENMEKRHHQIRRRLDHQAKLEAEKRRGMAAATTSSETEMSLDDLIHIGEPYYEAMEWEPIEEEKIVQEIKSVRAELSLPDENIEDQLKDSPKNPLSIDNAKTQALYIVIDTNVFLTSLQRVTDARDATFAKFGRPFIVIPWVVLVELDFIKDDKSKIRTESLKAKARQAINFINKHFSNRHLRVLGQTQFDVIRNRRQFSCSCPDDDILQTCLQIKQTNNFVILMSNDKNLCNKASFHDIETIGRMDPLEKIDYLQDAEDKPKSMLSVTLKLTNDEPEGPKSPRSREAELAEDLYEETTNVLRSFMTVIVKKEMEDLFGENWAQYAIITPPWTVITVLKCAIKHWIAAVSESFVKPAESIVKELHQTVIKLQYSRRLNDVDQLIERCYDLFQCVKNNKHSGLLNKFTKAIEELREKYAETMKEMHRYMLYDIAGGDVSEEEQQKAAKRAFKVFDAAYKSVRDFCGTVGEIISIPFPLSYEPDERIKENPEYINWRPQKAGHVNQLIQILSHALENIDNIHPYHPSIHALYSSLSAFESNDTDLDNSTTLAKFDIYWCLKKNTEILKIGLNQLQTVSQWLCQTASWKSD